jgi:hypothetical protein
LVVDLEGNSRPIEEIQEGDWVLARSEFDPQGPLELKRVEEKFVRTTLRTALLFYCSILSCSRAALHPFYVPAQERFVPAGELQVGDLLVSSQETLIPIESITSHNEITTVYNLRVADHHTYFVGGALWGWDVWVHNAYAEYSNVLRKAGVSRATVRSASDMINAGDSNGARALLHAALSNGKRTDATINNIINRAIGQRDTLRRPQWRSGFKAEIESAMPLSQNGKPQIWDLVDGNAVLRERLPGDVGEIGHKFGYEHRRLIREHASLTPKQFSNLIHSNPGWFRIETRKLAASHAGELN